jgi:hypothetical protein
MAIWNCTDDSNAVAHLLALALPNVNTEAEMVKLDVETLSKVTTYANSVTDCLLTQQAALADLIANADVPNLDKDTVANIGWLMRSLTELHEIVRRTSDMAAVYSGSDRQFYQAFLSGDKAEVERLTQ